MKKTTSIRLFFVLAATGCCVAYGGGYHFSTQQSTDDLAQEIASNNQPGQLPESLESAATISPYEFILYEVDGYVMVYCADGETIYSDTDIRVKNLPQKLQQEIQQGKKFYNEKELYNFLESYSS